MRHRIKGKKLNRNRSSRKALFIGLANSLIMNGEIKTTVAKAKFMKPEMEKIITRSKDNSLANRRILISRLQNEDSVKKLLEEIGPGFIKRPGGYTRIKKLNDLRKGDRAQMATISLVEFDKKEEKPLEKAEKSAKKSEAKTVKSEKKEEKKPATKTKKSESKSDTKKSE